MEAKGKTKNNKNGISLVVLLITIVVALIILSASTVKILDASDNATIASFAEELRMLEESSKEYYLQNNALPAVDSDINSPKTMEDILNLNSNDVGNSDRKNLAEEIGNNFDNSGSTLFYRLDLSKLGVSTTTRGVQKKGNEKDVYVIAYPSFRVYYIEGVSSKKIKYFSLSSKISGVYVGNTDLNNYIEETISSQNIPGLSVSRNVEGFSNKMGIIVTTTITNTSSEKLYLKLSGLSEKQITTTTVGLNTINIESNSFTSSELNLFNGLNANERYLEVIKKKDDLEVDRVKVDLSEYDNVCPTIVESSITLKNNSSTNTLYFDVSDVPIISNIVVQNGINSGISQVRYEYLRKLNTQTSSEENYYEGISDFTDSYMKAEAKKADISNSGTVKIEIPREVVAIKICVLDNAGNYTIYNQNTVGGVNVGYKLNSSNSKYLNVDLNIYSNEIITSGSVLISNDGGINFGSEKTFSNIPAYSTKTINFEYDNVLTFDKFAYLKVTLTKNSGQQETKIIKIDLNM